LGSLIEIAEDEKKMKQNFLFGFIWLVLCGCDNELVDTSPGVSWELAQHRSKTISNLEYDITLNIPETIKHPILGLETIRFDLSDISQNIVLDFRQPEEYIHTVKINGRSSNYLAENQHIIIDGSFFNLGKNQIEIEFRVGDMSLNRNDEFLYTLFVPDRAATAIPCFDQPNLKGRYTLTLYIPKEWTAVANGPLLDEVEKKDQRVFYFGETQPISTYLLAFAVGKFQKLTAERNGRKMVMYHRETDEEKVSRNSETIFNLHGSAIAWLEEYTGIDYPFHKFDFVLIPAFQYGGMEHPGAIFYKDVSLFLDESATKSQHLGRAGLIAHETAHMWFGDLVTMNWFDDVWTKEVFANFMGGKIVNPSFPEINHDLRFLSHYSSAYGVDRSSGANQIRQPLENLNMAGTLYGAIIYSKAPVVMKHLELLVGKEIFRNGMQKYLKQFSYRNATWLDLIQILDELSKEDLASWSKMWVEEPDRPIIDVAIDFTPNGTVRRLKLKQFDPKKKNRVWKQYLNVHLGYTDSDIVIPVYLKNKSVIVPETKGLQRPNYILPNGEGIGYGYFRMDKTTREYLLAHLPELNDPMKRGIGWLNLWEDMLYGFSSPNDLIQLAIRALETETDILNIQRILGILTDIFWHYLLDYQRQAISLELETALKTHLYNAQTVSLKSSFFRALRSITLTNSGISWLQNVWMKSDSISGIKFSERDYMYMAAELAIREKSETADILNTQLERIKNPDRKSRFMFVMPALSNDESVRDSFFESLKKEENRAREPWVQQAVGYLHHPLRARSAQKYIRPSLEILEEIQKTGDIFFPARFINATLAGHHSLSSVEIVNRFLEEHPDYSPKLKLKIFQASDRMFRASKILHQ
jgi:aminopeptidase N